MTLTAGDWSRMRAKVIEQRQMQAQQSGPAYRHGTYYRPGEPMALAASTTKDRPVYQRILDYLTSGLSGGSRAIEAGMEEVKESNNMAPDATLTFGQGLRGIIAGLNNVSEFGEGFSGALAGEPTYTRDVLREWLGAEGRQNIDTGVERVGVGLASLAGDIAGDPLTYLPFGALTKLKKADTAIPDEYLTATTADDLAREANPHLQAKQAGQANRSVRVQENVPTQTPGGPVANLEELSGYGLGPSSNVATRSPVPPPRPRANVQTPMQRAESAVENLPLTPAATTEKLVGPKENLEWTTVPNPKPISVGTAAGLSPDAPLTSVLSPEQMAKVEKLSQRSTETLRNVAAYPDKFIEKYGQRWRQSAINNGQDPTAVNAAWDAVKSAIAKQVEEIDTVITASGVSGQQAQALRQAGVAAIKSDYREVMKQASTEAMTARELTERIAESYRRGGTPNAAEVPSNPVPAGPKSVEAEPISITPTAPVDEAVEIAETNKATNAAVDAEKVVTVRPEKKSRAAVEHDLKNDIGPNAENFTAQIDKALNRALQGHSRKLTQKQINYARAGMKVVIARALKNAETRGKGRFNNFEQANLWEEIVKFLRSGEKNNKGLYSNLGLSWQKEASEFAVARELYYAAAPYLESVYTPSMWNGIRAGNKARYAMPQPEEIAKGFSQAAKAEKGRGSVNVPFSLEQLLRDMPDDIFRKTFAKKQPPGTYAVAMLQSAMWKGSEYLSVLPAEVQKWFKTYDSIAHVQKQHKRVQMFKNPAADGAIQANATNMMKSASSKSAPQIAADAAQAKNTTATSAAASGADAANTVRAGEKGSADAQRIADQAIHGDSTAGTATKRSESSLNNPTNSKRGQQRQNKASRKVHGEVNKAYSAAALTKLKANPDLAKRVTVSNNDAGMVIDPTPMDQTFMERVAHFFRTNYRKENIYPVFQNSYGAFHEVRASRGRHYSNIGRTFLTSPEGRAASVDALRVMGGVMDEASLGTDTLARQAYDQLRKIENLIGSPMLADYRKANVTATKAGLEMEHVNKWVRHQGVHKKDRTLFQFTTLEDGRHWLDSLYDPEVGLFKGITEDNVVDVFQQMHSIEEALTGAAFERMVFDDLAVRGFVSEKPQKGWVKVASETMPYVDGMYAHKDIAEELRYLVQFMDDIKKPGPNSSVLKYFDTVLRAFKTGVTIYNPQHHVRNFVGDAWLLYADGGKSRHMTQAAEVLRKYPYHWSQKGEFQVLGSTEDFLTGNSNTLNTRGGKTYKWTNKSTGSTFTDEEIIRQFHRRGLAIPAENIEDIIALSRTTKLDEILDKQIMGTKSTLRNPAQGNIHNFWSQISMHREHMARLSHMIHAVEDVKVPPNIKKRGADATNEYIIDEAIRRTRQWHPDGLDLTRGERTWARRAIPFYSWQRKSIPLILMAAARRPVLFTYERKVSNAIGFASVDQDDYMPGDQLFPVWLRGDSWGSLGKVYSDNNGTPTLGHRLISGPGTPGTDFLEMITGAAHTSSQVPGETIKDVAGQLNPMFRAPAELIGNSSWRTGAPIRDTRKANAFADYTEYFAENAGIPYAGVVSRGRTNKSALPVDALNFLAATGLIDTGGYQTAAELSERDLQAYLRDKRGE